MNYKFIVINTSGGGDWVIDDNVDNGGAYIRSKNKHLINLPQNGWEYISNNEWYDDTTMQVKGNYISFSIIYESKKPKPRRQNRWSQSQDLRQSSAYHQPSL